MSLGEEVLKEREVLGNRQFLGTVVGDDVEWGCQSMPSLQQRGEVQFGDIEISS